MTTTPPVVPSPAAPARAVRSPLGLRLSIHAGAVLFGLLVLWLLGFLVRDVGDRRYIDHEAIRRELADAELDDSLAKAERELASLDRAIAANGERQAFLSSTVGSNERTLNQMLDLQRARLEADEAPAPEQVDATAAAQRAFLAAQEELQGVLRAGQDLRDQRRDVAARLDDLRDRMRRHEETVAREVRRRVERLDLEAAFLKLLILLPALGVGWWLFARRRRSPAAPLIYAYDAAVVWRLLLIIHEHFPTRYHKYIFLGLALLVVGRGVWVMIQRAARPGAELILRRFREAYQKRECPGCGYPIERRDLLIERLGHALGRRAEVKVSAADLGADEPYTCPSCGLTLYDRCPACEGVRHTLLPHCRHCGAPSSAAPEAAAAAPDA